MNLRKNLDTTERISASPKGRNAYAFSGDDLEAALDAELEVR